MDIKTRRDLYKLLPATPCVAEIGVAEGLFSRDILTWSPFSLILVDMWECHPEFPGDAGHSQEWHNNNYENVRILKSDVVQILRGPSVAMADLVPRGTLDLVYIDACHSYDCVRADIQAWATKLKTGGVIAFHDVLSPEYGVNQAVYEWAREIGKDVHIIPELRSADASAWVKV